MRHAADTGYAFGEHCRRRGQTLEPFLHAAMLEEQARLVVQDCLTDVIEEKFGRLEHVGADRAERQLLDVGRRAGDLRNEAPVLVNGDRRVRRVIGREGRHYRVRAFPQYQPVRLRLIGELEPEQIGDLALVPAHQRTQSGEARHGTMRTAAPDGEGDPRRTVQQITQFERGWIGPPRICHLHPRALG